MLLQAMQRMQKRYLACFTRAPARVKVQLV